MTREEDYPNLVTKGRQETSLQSYFFRNRNLRVLSRLIHENAGKYWKILSVGCGYGPEPQEIALRTLIMGSDNFQIDAIDISKSVIQRAKLGIIPLHMYKFSEEYNFMREAAQHQLLTLEGKIINETDSIWNNQKDRRSVDFHLAPNVQSKIYYDTHDMVVAPFGLKDRYDIVICNNLLPHYNNLRRDLITTHIVHGLKDKGIFTLEEPRSLTISLDPEPKRIVWLRPNFRWQEKLGLFGLTPEKFEVGETYFPIYMFRYAMSNDRSRIDSIGTKSAHILDQIGIKINK